MRTAIILLMVLSVSCGPSHENDEVKASMHTVSIDPCDTLIGALDRPPGGSTFEVRRATYSLLDQADSWQLYLNGKLQIDVVILDSTNSSDCLMARYFNEVHDFPDSLHIIAGDRVLLSVDERKSPRFLDAIYPIPIPEIFSRLGDSSADTVNLRVAFDTHTIPHGFRSETVIRVVR